MKIIKKILLFLAAIVVLLLIAGIFVGKDFGSVKEVTVNKPLPEVFAYVSHLKNQNDYGVWAKKDPNIKQEYRGVDGTPGFVSAWEGNSDVGKGEQKIVTVEDGKRVDFELHFIKPFESFAPAWMETEAISPAQTKVKWGMSGTMSYPFNVMRLFMNMDKMIGEDLQTGLNNLKAQLEKK